MSFSKLKHIYRFNNILFLKFENINFYIYLKSKQTIYTICLN